MKKLIFLFAALVWSALLMAQQQFSIGSPNNSEAFSDVQINPADGSSIYAGNTVVAGDQDVYIVKLDVLGQKLWSRTIVNPGTDALYKVVVCANGDYVAAGQFSVAGVIRGFICRISTTGALIWTSASTNAPPAGGTAGDRFWDVTETALGNIVAVGSNNYVAGPVDGFIVSLNAAGAVNWSWRNNDGSSVQYQCVSQLQNGNIVVGGMTYQTTYQGLVLEFTEAGVLQCQGNYIVAGPYNSMWFGRCYRVGTNALFYVLATNGTGGPSREAIYTYTPGVGAAPGTMTGNVYNYTGTGAGGSQTIIPVTATDYIMTQTPAAGAVYVTRTLNGNAAPIYNRQITGNTVSNVYASTANGNNLILTGNRNADAYAMFSNINFPLQAAPCSIIANNNVNVVANAPALTANSANWQLLAVPVAVMTSPVVNLVPYTDVVTNLCVAQCPPDATSAVTKCAAASVTLSARAGTTWNWSPSTGLSASNVQNPLCTAGTTTTYTVTVTNTATGCTNNDIVTVTVNGRLNTTTAVAKCLNTPVTLNAGAGLSWAWAPGTGLSATNTQNPVCNINVSSSYSVIIINSGGSSCNNTDVYNVTVSGRANTTTNINKCSNAAVTLNAAAGTAWSWSPVTNLSSSTVQNPVCTAASSTTYTVSITNSGSTTCSNDDIINVNIVPAPVVSLSDSITICSGETATLTTTVSGGGSYTYSWSSVPAGFTSTLASPVISPTVNTIYTVVVTSTTSPFCSTSKTISVRVNDCHCEDPCSWSLTGNNLVLPYQFIGPKNAEDFRIRTANTQKMVVKTDGKVGINTNTPTKLLDVNGEASIKTLPPVFIADKLVVANTVGDLKSLVPGNSNQYLSGTGVWQDLPTNGGTLDADNGLTSNGSTVSLGDDCTRGGGAFKSSREINMNDYNLYFNSANFGKIFMGQTAAREYIDCKVLSTRLEIEARELDPINGYSNDHPSPSGLRFTNLTAETPPVKNETNGVLSLDYNGDVIWVQSCCRLTEIPGEVETKLAAITDRLDKLEKALQEMQQQNSTLKAQLAQMDVFLSDKNTIVLNQNVPNPFAENTMITYSIPKAFRHAQIVFSTVTGEVIKTAEIKQAGKGMVTVYAKDISSGLYTYTLVVDGQRIDTKKMIKQ